MADDISQAPDQAGIAPASGQPLTPYRQKIRSVAVCAYNRYIKEEGHKETPPVTTREEVSSDKFVAWLERHPLLAPKSKRNIRSAIQQCYQVILPLPQPPSMKSPRKEMRLSKDALSVDAFIETNRQLKLMQRKHSLSGKKTTEGIPLAPIFETSISIFVALAITGLSCRHLFCSSIDYVEPTHKRAQHDADDGILNSVSGWYEATIFTPIRGKTQPLQTHLKHLTVDQLISIQTAIAIKGALINIYANHPNRDYIAMRYLDKASRCIIAHAGLPICEIRQKYPPLLNKLQSNK